MILVAVLLESVGASGVVGAAALETTATDATNPLPVTSGDVATTII